MTILNHINYKMPIYKDCTLGELMFVGACVLIIESITLSIITQLLFGIAWIGLALTLLTLLHITRFFLGRLQRVKYGKPYGYYQQLFKKKLQHQPLLQGLMKLPYIQRLGKWSVRRMI